MVRIFVELLAILTEILCGFLVAPGGCQNTNWKRPRLSPSKSLPIHHSWSYPQLISPHLFNTS